MTIKGIRHLARMLTASDAEGDSPSPFTSADAPSTTRSGSDHDAGSRDEVIDLSSGPRAVEMAAPSFMILSVRPRREDT